MNTGIRGFNVFAVVALTALLVIALVARGWLGLTGAGQLDPLALLVSVALATGLLMFALPTSAQAQR